MKGSAKGVTGRINHGRSKRARRPDDGPATFNRYMGLKLERENMPGRHVDLGTPQTLRPELRDRVEQDLSVSRDKSFASAVNSEVEMEWGLSLVRVVQVRQRVLIVQARANKPSSRLRCRLPRGGASILA